MTRAFITGVTGCLGSALAAALLERGVEVSGLCVKGAPMTNIKNLKLELIQGDVLEPLTYTAALKGVDWVFHVAAIADDWHFGARAVYRTNVQGTQTMLKAALEAGVSRFVHTSSAAILGVPRAGQPMMDETCQFNLKHHDWVYAYSKVLAEKTLLNYVSQGLNAISVLPSAIMGPGDLSFISGAMIKRVLDGEVFPLPEGGINFVDVRDVAEAHIAAAECGQPGERFLVSGHNLSHLRCLGTISDVLGVPVKYMTIPRLVLPAMSRLIETLRSLRLPMPLDGGRIRLSGQYMYYDNRKAVQKLGLKPRRFEDTIEDTFRWYLDHHLLKDDLKAPRRAPRLYPEMAGLM